MDNDQNQINNSDASNSEIFIHTLQDDLDSLGIKPKGGVAVSQTTSAATAPAKGDKTTSGDDSERGREASKNASPFLTSTPASGSVAKPETKIIEEKKEKEKPAGEKTGFFGLGRFFKKSEEKKEEPRQAQQIAVKTVPKETPKIEESKKPNFPLSPELPVRKPVNAGFVPAPAPKEVFPKEEIKRPFFPESRPIPKAESPRPVFAPQPPQKKPFQADNKPAVAKAEAAATAIEKPKEKAVAGQESNAGGFFGVFRKREGEKTAEEIAELKKDRVMLEQKNKELEQARVSLEEKVKQYTGELKAIKENEEKLIRHTKELRENEASLDHQVMEKNKLLKEKIRQAEEFRESTKEKEAKMLSLKTKIGELEKEVLEQEEKIKKAQEKTGIFGMIRKMRNRRLIESGENLRKIHYALEKKNNELKQAKESLEEGMRQQMRELKEIKEKEEKAQRHLEEMRKSEAGLNQQVTEKSKELKEKFEMLKVNLERQVVEKSGALKEKMKKLAEMNDAMVEREQKIGELKAKIEKVEKEIAAKKADADEILKKAEREIAAKEALAKAKTEGIEKEITAKEISAKAKLEGIEKEIAARKASAEEIMKKAQTEIAAKEALAKAKLEEIEKEIVSKKASAEEILKKAEQEAAAKEAAAKAKLQQVEKEFSAKEALAKAKLEELKKKAALEAVAIKEKQKGGGLLFGLFGKKSEQQPEKAAENKTPESKAPDSLPIKTAPAFEIGNKAEASSSVNGASQSPIVPAKKEELEKKIETPAQKAAQIKKPQWGKVFATAMVVSIVIVICASSYVFLTTRSNNISIQNESAPIAELPVVEVPQSVFSADKPNYLNIDVESTSSLKITQLLVSTSIEVKEAQIAVPVEFLVTDSNNNPLSFAVFANLFGLNMSADVLSSLEEGFSLFIYNDNGNARVALAIDLKSKELAASGLIKEEAGLNKSLWPLFLGEPTEKGAVTFKEGQYKGNIIRYANLNSQGTASLDYTFVDGQLVIGTSKDTLRAVLDKIGVAEVKDGNWQQ